MLFRSCDHLPPHKYIRNTSTCGTTPTEHLLNADRRPQTSQKARNSPHTWVGKKEKEKTKTKEQGRDLNFWEGAVKEKKFPHTRKPLHWWRRGGGWAGGKLWSHRGERSNRGAEGKEERFPHRGSVLTSTHQPERLGLRRSDPRERTGVGCVNTACRGLVCHS